MKDNLYLDLRSFCRFFAAGVVMMLCVISTEAQNWALPSSRWQYISDSPGQWGPTPPEYCCELHVEKDTIVNNTLCRKISGAEATYHPTYYTYDSLGVVYILLDHSFRPTYDFNALTGDTIMFYDDTTRYPNGNYAAERRILAVVDSITILSSHGQHLRHYHMKAWRYGASISASYDYHYFTYAERIGLYDGFEEAEIFYPQFTTPTDFPKLYICDYADSTMTGGYWFYETNCLTTGISEYQGANWPKCYPNPSSGTFMIDMSGYGPEIKTVHIYDALGRVMYSGESDVEETRLDLHLPTGVYTVELAQDRRCQRGKVVIE